MATASRFYTVINIEDTPVIINIEKILKIAPTKDGRHSRIWFSDDEEPETFKIEFDKLNKKFSDGWI